MLEFSYQTWTIIMTVLMVLVGISSLSYRRWWKHEQRMRAENLEHTDKMREERNDLFTENLRLKKAAIDPRELFITKQRDKFARAALTAMVAGDGARMVADRDGRYDETNWKEVVAANAYEFADAMMKQRLIK